jgi:hypothetical protein
MINDLTSTVIGVLAGVPIWGLLLYFVYRNIGKRDSFESSINAELEAIKRVLNSLDKNMALISKDIDHAANLSKAVAELTERVSKQKYDIDNYFERLRAIEKSFING